MEQYMLFTDYFHKASAEFSGSFADKYRAGLYSNNTYITLHFSIMQFTPSTHPFYI